MSEEKRTDETVKSVEDIRKEAEEKACPVQRTLYFIQEFIAGPMCSKCYPCSLGTAEALIRLLRISGQHKDGSHADIQVLRRIGLTMIEGSFCKKGKDTGRFIVEALSASEDAFSRHISGECLKKECIDLIAYSIDPALCTMCGNCLEACTHNAIWGETKKAYLAGYLPFEILPGRCVKCGDCLKICPAGAIMIKSGKREPAKVC